MSSTHVNEMVVYSLVAVEKSQPPTVQNTNESIRDASKMSHQPVGVWSERPMFRKNKNCENFFWRVWMLFRKNFHRRKLRWLETRNSVTMNCNWNKVTHMPNRHVKMPFHIYGILWPIFGRLISLWYMLSVSNSRNKRRDLISIIISK